MICKYSILFKFGINLIFQIRNEILKESSIREATKLSLNQSIFASQENLSEILKTRNPLEDDEQFEIANLWEDYGTKLNIKILN